MNTNLSNLLKRIASEKEVFQNHMLRWTRDYFEDPEIFAESFDVYSSKPDIVKAVKTLQAEDLESLPKYETPQTQEIEELLTLVYLEDRVKADQIVDILTSELEYRRRERRHLNAAETFDYSGDESCP